jgi:hypothetical protein
VSATHTVDIDEIQTTRGEKVLALVLTVFLLIGLVWAYVKLDTRDSYWQAPTLTPAERAAVDAYTQAQNELVLAEGALSVARSDLEIRRERYRTALDAGQAADALATDYHASERTFANAEEQVAAADARVAETKPAADEANKRRNESVEAKQRREARETFLLRLGFLLLVLGGAYGLLHAFRGSRYFTLALAAVGAGAILTVVFAGDYVEDYVEWNDTGVVVLSLAGIALTVIAFWSLQRYLQRRIPLRRVRKGECPFCGFPVGGNSRCEGCGRTVSGSCAHCGEKRRVGVQFCGSCGTA